MSKNEKDGSGLPEQLERHKGLGEGTPNAQRLFLVELGVKLDAVWSTGGANTAATLSQGSQELAG